MILSLILFLGILMLSMVFTFFLHSALSSEKLESNPAMEAIVQTNLALMTTSTIDLVSSIVSDIIGKSILFISTIPSQALNIARVGAVVGFAVLFHEGYQSYLSGGDQIFRVLLGPLFQDVIFSVFQVFRLFFDAIVPLYNYYSTIMGQLINGSIAIAIKCDISTVVETLKLIVLAFMSLFQSTAKFAGGTTVENNAFVNEWNITEPLMRGQMVFANQKHIASCICDGLTDVFDLMFIIVSTKHLPRALNHAFNIPVSFVQEIVQLMPPYTKMPVFSKTVHHTVSMVYEYSKFLDTSILKFIENTLQLFVPEFYLRGAPKQFIFATQARLFMAGVETVHTMFRTWLHMQIPLPALILNQEYMMDVTDNSKSLIHLGLWNHGNANMLHWLLLLLDKMATGAFKALASNGKFELVGVPEHVDLSCSIESTKGYIKTPCLIYLVLQVPINFLYLSNALLLDVFWKSIMFQEQNLWRTLQRYDGMWQSRDIAYSCEHRRDNMNWDVTRGTCICEKPENLDDPYDPYCGQPTMQAHVWEPTMMAFKMAFNGFLGDTYYLPLKTQIQAFIEVLRVISRTVLAFPDIIEQNYFDLPINCGWGTGDFESSGCNIRRHPRNQINYCEGTNREGCTCNPALPLNETTLCQCIYYFPDAEQEVAQGGYSNPLLEDLYKAQHHWCGTYHFENIFMLTDKFAYFIDNIIGKFAPSFDNFCETQAYAMLATDVLQYKKSEWNDNMLDEYGITYNKESCILYGSHNFLCSASMTLRTTVQTFTQQVRAILMTMFSFLTGDVQNFKLDISERLCDLQRTAASASATFASLYGMLLDKEIQKGVAMMTFSIMDFFIVGIRNVNNYVLWITDVIRGVATGDGIENASADLVVNNLNLWLDWTRRLMQGMGTFVNGLQSGAGDLFYTVDLIISIIQRFMSKAIVELVASFFKVAVMLIQMFDTSVTANERAGILLEIGKFVKILFFKLIDIITELMAELFKPFIAPINAVVNGIKTAITSICGAINSAIDWSGASISCPSFRAGHGGHVPLFQAAPNTPLLIAEKIEWDGTSKCDLMVEAYKDYTWNTLRPIEKIEIKECLHLRHLAIELANATELPIPKDLFYNWMRKYQVVYEVGVTFYIYSKHLTGSLSTKEMVTEMRHSGVAQYLPIARKIKDRCVHTFTVPNAIGFFDSLVKDLPDDGLTGSFKTIYTSVSTIGHHSKEHFQKIGPQMETLIHLMPRKYNNIEPFQVFKHLKSMPPLFQTLSKDRPMAPSKVKARNALKYVLGAAGVNADIQPCHQQEGSKVCLNCVIVDNFLNTVINEGERMASYYTHTYVPIIIPSFVNYFKQQENKAKAWREDMGQILQNAAVNAAEELNNVNITLKSSLDLSPQYLAQKDWDYLFKNWAIRNDREILDIGIQFLQTVNDSYVPFTGYGLGYYITYPFVEACPIEIVYCTTSTTKERLGYISKQIGYQAAIWGGLYGAQIYTGAPLFTMATMFPLNLGIVGGVYMYSVYGFLYTCLPNIPNCFVDDLFAWFHDVAFPDCFCSYYPGLADSCDPETCHLTSRSTTFKNCSTAVPLSESMGYFWSPAFWVRKDYPDAFLWLYQTPPFSWGMKYSDGLKEMAFNIEDNVEITQTELDCSTLRFTDTMLLATVGYLASIVLSIVVSSGIKLLVNGIKFVTIIFNTLYSFGVATEVQTITGVPGVSRTR